MSVYHTVYGYKVLQPPVDLLDRWETTCRGFSLCNLQLYNTFVVKLEIVTTDQIKEAP